MLQALPLREIQGRCRTPRAEGADKAAKAQGTTGKSWWELSEENSEVATPRGRDKDHADGAAGYSWSGIQTASQDTTFRSSWQPSEESCEVSKQRGLVGAGADEAAQVQGTPGKSWWEPPEENPEAAPPRGRNDGHDGSAGCSWSRITTPSPDGRWYVRHGGPAAWASQLSLLPLPAQQQRRPHHPQKAAPVPTAAAVPPPPQPLRLAEVLQLEGAERDRAPRGVAGPRPLRQEGRSDPGAAAGGPGQSAADARVLSIGSEGHPHGCAQPCKYSRGGRVCKDGAACSRCHLCPWSREQGRGQRSR